MLSVMVSSSPAERFRANAFLHGAEEALRILDPGRRRSADVKAHLAGVDGGKEVAPQERNQGQRHHRDAGEREDEYPSVVESRLQRTTVRLAQPLETPLDPPASSKRSGYGRRSPLQAFRFGKEIADQGGNQRAREEI